MTPMKRVPGPGPNPGPTMPDLRPDSARPLGSGWKQGVKPVIPASARDRAIGARVVQHHYTRAMVRDINIHRRNKLVGDALAWLEQKLPQWRGQTALLMDAFDHMSKRIGQADLTINFDAKKWFLTANPYSGYTQMYERAVTNVGGHREMRLTGDSKNPADVRDKADWIAMQTNAMKSSSAQWGGVHRVMGTGGVTKVSNPVNTRGDDEYVANNPDFVPSSRQVFAGLNYGRRRHGACTYYGMSHLVLSDDFKVNALYYAGDTFFATIEDTDPLAAMAPKVKAQHQVSYDLLAAVCPLATPTMQKDLFESCYQGTVLKDDDSSFILLEAHLYDRLQFRGGVKKAVVSMHGLDGPETSLVRRNASDFGRKHGFPVHFIE